MTAVLDWYGCATFRLTLGGTVVFLDAYVEHAPGAPGADGTADDVDRADWILVGHSHFDHLWGAETVARNTGATIVGSYETVRVMESVGVPTAQLMPVSGGERVRLGEGVTATVLPSLHSCVWAGFGMQPPDEVCVGDEGLTYQEILERGASLMGKIATNVTDDLVNFLVRSNQGPKGDGGALVYLIETPEGRLLYQDTSGHWSKLLNGLRPDVAILAAAGRANIDGNPMQGSLAEFIAQEVELVGPAKVILCHHDDFLPGFSASTDITPIVELVAKVAPDVAVVELGYMDAHNVFA